MDKFARLSKIFGTLVAAFLWVFGPIVNQWDHHEDETPDDNVVSAVQEKQVAAILPPSTPAPVLARPLRNLGPRPLGGIPG